MEGLYLPTLHTFANKNTFTGSCGMFRFRIVPKVTMKTQKEVDMDASSMEAEYWHGLFSYDKSEIEGKESFPMSEAGRNAMLAWLESHI